MPSVKFYFDFLSPFSYFAWMNHSKVLAEAEFEYIPVSMGKLFGHHEFPGPGEIPAKRNYELKKCFRYAHDEGIPFHPPAQFPFNPIAILRAATKAAAGNQQKQVIDLIFKKVWQEGCVLEDPELIEKLLPSEVYENSFTKEARSELKANIKSAISDGAFGVPSFIFHEELFWGNDNLVYLKRAIEGNDKWNKELYDDLVEK